MKRHGLVSPFSCVLAISVSGVAVVASTLFGMSSAGAAGGTWGAAHYRYLDGTVCTSGSTTTPFASWDFGSHTPAFLVTPVISNGSIDTAALPFATTGRQTSGAVATGEYGFSSDADIATYASLLTHFGTGTRNASEVAAAVYGKSSSSAGSCVGDGSALVNSAAALAGPYTTTLTTNPSPPVIGATTRLIATVTGATGVPVPGVTVTFNSAQTSLSAPTAVTDSSGVAAVNFTVPTGLNAPSLSVTASTSVSVGLTRVSATSTPTASDPSGSVVDAIYAAPPVTTHASLDIIVDPTAHPSISAGTATRAVSVGGQLTPTATVSGMNGHQGTATFDVLGPLPLAAGSLCANAQGWSASTPVAATSGTLVLGNGTVTGNSWRVTAPGCYLIRATVATTDATPPATADSGFGSGSSTVTALAATATLAIDHQVVGRGPMKASVTVTESAGIQGQVVAHLIGPAPGSTSAGSCAGVDWGRAAPSSDVSVPTNGDGTVNLSTAPITAPGCYQVQGAVKLPVPGFGVATVAINPPANGGVIIAVAPVVTQHADQLWSTTPGNVGTHVQVTGLYGQAAHVAVQMLYLPADPLGCAHASWSHATLAAVGPSVSITGDTSNIAVASGATVKAGCYLPVAKVTIDADSSVVALGPRDGRYNALIAAPASLDSLDTGPSRGGSADLSAFYRTLVGFIVLLGFTALAAVYIGWRGRGRGRAGLLPAAFLPVQDDLSGASGVAGPDDQLRMQPTVLAEQPPRVGRPAATAGWPRS
ncbi:Ig-like domain (group 1) [Frankineae bacterium MT45]|nr:Ig-like domain (group 1) [Frankineae bacterium MT45]